MSQRTLLFAANDDARRKAVQILVLLPIWACTFLDPSARPTRRMFHFMPISIVLGLSLIQLSLSFQAILIDVVWAIELISSQIKLSISNRFQYPDLPPPPLFFFSSLYINICSCGLIIHFLQFLHRINSSWFVYRFIAGFSTYDVEILGHISFHGMYAYITSFFTRCIHCIWLLTIYFLWCSFVFHILLWSCPTTNTICFILVSVVLHSENSWVVNRPIESPHINSYHQPSLSEVIWYADHFVNTVYIKVNNEGKITTELVNR